MFLTTLSFLFSLPGWEQSLGGFPALSGNGGFLLKDIVLLGAADVILSAAKALQCEHVLRLEIPRFARDDGFGRFCMQRRE